MNEDPSTSHFPACTCQLLGPSISSASEATVSAWGVGGWDHHHYKPRKGSAQKPGKAIYGQASSLQPCAPKGKESDIQPRSVL